MAFQLGALVARIRIDTTDLNRVSARVSSQMREVRTRANDALRGLPEDMGRVGEEAGDRLAEGLTRDAAGRLRNARGQFVRDGEKLGQALGDSAGKAASRSLGPKLRVLREDFARVGQSLSRIGVVTGLAVLAGQAINLAAALAPVLSILYAIPGALAVAGSGLATLLLGFSGLGEALKTGGAAAGGAAVDTKGLQRAVDDAAKSVERAKRGVESARQAVVDALADVEDANYGVTQALRAVELAQERVTESARGLASAQKNAKKAQEQLTEARERATRALKDYQNQQQAGKLDEQEASIAVEEARKRLGIAEKNGLASEVEKRRARIDLAQAELRYQDIIQNNVDLQKEVDKANAKGVDGADAVVEAQERVADSAYAVQEAQRNERDSLYEVQEAMRGVVQARGDVVDANRAVAEAEQGVIDAQEEVIDANERLTDALAELSTGGAGAAAALNKADEAMSKLSPNAQRLVRAIISLKAPFSDLRRLVQDNLFDGVDKSVLNLANASLPTLRKGLGNIATAFNQMFRAGLDAASTPLFQGNLAKVFESTTRITEKFADVTGPLTLALSNLAVAALPVVERFTDFITEGAKAFAEFANGEDGVRKLTEKMDKAADAISDVFSFLMAVAAVISTVFTASQGQGFLDNLTGIVEKFNEFLKTPEGQEDLATFFQSVKEASQALADVLSVLVPALLSAFRAINGLPAPFRSAIYVVGALVLVLVPLVNVVASVVTGISLLVRFVSFLAKPIGLVVSAVGRLLPLLGRLLLTVGRFAGPVGILVYLVQVVIDIFTNWETHIESLKNKFTVLVDVASIIVQIFNNIGSVLFGDATANGGSIIDGLTQGLSEKFGNLKESIEQVGRDTIDAFKRILGINSPSTVFAGFGGDILQGLINGLTGAVGAVVSTIGNIASSIYNGFVGVVASIGSALGTARTVVSGKIDEIVGQFPGLPEKIKNALGSLGSTLYSAGQDIIQGLLDGIGSKLSTLGNFMANKLPAELRDPFKKALGIASPSKVFRGFGKNIPEGLVQGIQIGTAAVAQAVRGVSNAVVGAYQGATAGLSTRSALQAAPNAGFASVGNAPAQKVVNITQNVNASQFTPAQIQREANNGLLMMERRYG